MKTCTNCNTPYDDSKRFCRNCGSQLIAIIQIDPNELSYELSTKKVLDDRLNADPFNVEILHEYSHFLFNNLLFKEAITVSLKILAINENDLTTRELIFKSYIKLDMQKEAFENGQHLLSERPDDIFILVELAEISTALGNIDKAKDYHDKITSLKISNSNSADLYLSECKTNKNDVENRIIYEVDKPNKNRKTIVLIVCSLIGLIIIVSFICFFNQINEKRNNYEHEVDSIITNATQTSPIQNQEIKGNADPIASIQKPEIKEQDNLSASIQNQRSKITDIDGNEYNTITIGTQEWIVENLKTSRYLNGDLIETTIPVSLNISGERAPKYQWAYDGEEKYIITYGRLYTWFAATDIRFICPKEWHLPSDAEWTALSSYLGGEAVAAGKLKEQGTGHWFSPNTGATNSSGFTALPGGFHYSGGTFDFIRLYGNWRSSSEYNTIYAWSRTMSSNNRYMSRRNFGSKKDGLSIRCIRDN